MSPEKAREIANENGFLEFSLGKKDHLDIQRGCLLYPQFWKALGKGVKWPKTVYGYCGKEVDDQGPPCCWYGQNDFEWFEDGWKWHWKRFIDEIADGGTIDSFFAEL